MARTRNTALLDGKIRDAEKKVSQAKDRYDSAVSELQALLEERKELQMKQLMREIEKSGKSFDEIIRLIRL